MTSPGGQEVGRVSVRVLPDTSGFSRELLAELKSIETRTLLSVRADVDTTGMASEARAAVAAAEATAGKVRIKTELDTRGAQSDVLQLSRSINGVAATAASLGPALIPIAAGLAAAFGAVAVPLVAATAGLGAFAVFAVPTITKITEASAELKKAQEKVTAATTDKQRETALRAQAALIASLNPAQVAAVQSLDKLKQTFGEIQTALAPDIFKVFNAGLGVITAVLPSIQTLAKVVAPTLAALGTSLAAAVAGDEFKGFVTFLADRAPGAIAGLAGAIGSIARGFASMLQALDPLTSGITSSLGGLAASFATFGESNGFQSFIAYVQQIGPMVVTTIAAVAEAFGRVLLALAPIGAVALPVIETLAAGINALPLPVLTGLVVAIAGIAAAIAVANIVLSVYAAVMAVAAAATILAASPILLVVAALALLAGAFVVAYRHSDSFRADIQAGFERIKAAGQALADFVTKTIPAAFDAVRTRIAIAVAQVIVSVTGAWNRVRGVTVAVFNAVVAFIAALPGRAVAALASLGGRLSASASAAWNAYRAAMSAVVGGIIGFVAGIPGRIVGALGNLGGLLVSAGGDLLRGLASGITGAIGGVIEAATGAARAAVSAVKGALGISSPSKVMMELGGYTGQGYAIGLANSAGKVASASEGLAGAVHGALSDGTSAAGQGLHPLDPKGRQLSLHVGDGVVLRAYVADTASAANRTQLRDAMAGAGL